MRIEDELAQRFSEAGWTWHLKGDRDVVPSSDDVEQALDLAAKRLYDGRIGDQLEVGRLIIKKTARGHDVYMYVGPYE